MVLGAALCHLPDEHLRVLQPPRLRQARRLRQHHHTQFTGRNQDEGQRISGSVHLAHQVAFGLECLHMRRPELRREAVMHLLYTHSSIKSLLRVSGN